MTATKIEPTTPASDRPPAPTSSGTTFTYDVAVVGLGYVGLPTALAFHAAGLRVLGVDVAENRLRAIRAELVDAIDSDRARLESALRSEAFHLSTNAAMLSRAEAVIVCVPTPVDQYLSPDLDPLRAACSAMVEHAVAGQLLMLTSTTYVGCTEDLVANPARRRGLIAGEDIFVAFSAERIDPGSDAMAQELVPRVVGGATAACAERAATTLTGYAARVHRVPSLATAEMTKLLENTFRAVNIALANEFADICRSLELEVSDVIDAASTKPYGYMAFRPGPGVGGHCIPCDPHYLLWQLRKARVAAPVITTAMDQISRRPAAVVDRIRALLSERGMSLSGARVLVVGVAYKPGVADVRESPALEIITRLRDAGCGVGYVDPLVTSITLQDGSALEATRYPAAFRPSLVLLHTPHDPVALDWLRPDQLLLDATYQLDGSTNRVSL